MNEQATPASGKTRRVSSSSASSRSCLLVAGMHRSGTSVFTRTAGLLGFALPETPIPAGKENATGFWESLQLVERHDALLSELGTAWYDWRKIAIDSPDVQAVFRSHQNGILSEIDVAFGDASGFVLKDPRICRFIPLIVGAMREHGIATHYLIPIRAPLEVAESLFERNGMPLTQGILLWMRHVLDAELFTRGGKRSIVSYDEVLQDWRVAFDKIAVETGLAWPHDFEKVSLEIDTYIDRALRHHDIGQTSSTGETTAALEPLLSWASELLSIMLAGASKPFEARLEEIRRDFDLVAPILYAHHMHVSNVTAPPADRLYRDLYFIRSTLDGLRVSSLEGRRENLTIAAEVERLQQEALMAREETTAMRQLVSEARQDATKTDLLLEESRRAAAELQSNLESERQAYAHALEEIASLQKAKRYAEAQLERLSRIAQIHPPVPVQPARISAPLDTQNASADRGTELIEASTAAVDPPPVCSNLLSPIATPRIHLRFDVVVPVYNSVHWVAACLEELLRYRPANLSEIIVVDDRSRPDEAEHLADIIKRFPGIRLIVNTAQSGGFGYACNIGAKASSSPHILFLNTDCLVTPHALDFLSETLEENDDVALACPFSNNSPSLTYPMFPGRNYLEMAEILRLSGQYSAGANSIEACTVVGNCLMVKRDFFEHVGGFAPEWKEGYGEETELQMLAMRMGLKGVVDLRAYVYHFGGGSFNYLENVEQLRLSNHRRFMKKWRTEFLQLERRTSEQRPLDLLDANLRRHFEKQDVDPRISLDVLFYLPGLKQDIGGLTAVVAICNALVRNGIRAACAIVGPQPELSELNYKEPVLFRFLLYSNDAEFLKDNVVMPKVVVSTIFTSADVVATFASGRNITAVQFVQGYEPFFENGRRSHEAMQSYQATEKVLTTSSWLASMIKRHLRPDQELIRMPLISNPDIFFPSSQPRDIDICFVLRSAPDKGQWMLMEIFDRLRKEGRKFAVLVAPDYAESLTSYGEDIEVIKSPVDHYTLGRLFRRARVFVDASHHEGYGLLPLEAAMSGCEVIVSDSGGVRDIRESFDISIVPLSADPQPFVDAVENALKKAPDHVTFDISDRSRQDFEKTCVMVNRWVEVIRTLGEGVTPVPAGFLPVRHAVPVEQPVVHQPGRFRRRTINLAVSLYYRIKPYLPQRFVIAMRYLILGR